MNQRASEWTVAPAQSEESLHVREYLGVVRRRRWYFLLPAALILATATVLAFTLPPTYRSTGKILIEQQEIPQEWVPATVTSFADQRIQAMSQRVLTTANLTRVVEKFHLYTKERQREGTEAVVQRMRDDFNVDMISAKVRDPRTGRSGVATIAFSVSFDHRSPVVAQKVANDLVSLYLEENVKTRTQAVADTTRFLEEEAKKLGAQLADMEARIADFKRKNMGRLPEQQDLNIQLMQRAEQALVETQRTIRSLEDRKTFLESALAQMRNRPVAVDGSGGTAAPETVLYTLRMRYASLSGIYAEDHPDLVRLRRQIEALERGVAGGGQADTGTRLESLRKELLALQERYSEEHPDVVRLRNEISQLEKQAGQKEQVPLPDGAESPVLVKTRAELKTVESELQSAHRQADKYTAMVKSIEQRLSDTPTAEQQYRKLVRDHENLLVKYREIRDKQSTARVAESLEEERKGERFSLIEPPQLPEEPIKPNRPVILVLGLMASLMGGLGTVVTREMVDDKVRRARAVVSATGVPVLAIIPRIETSQEQRRARLTKLWVLAAFVVGVIIAAALVHFYYRPLDVLFYDIAHRRLGLL